MQNIPALLPNPRNLKITGEIFTLRDDQVSNEQSSINSLRRDKELLLCEFNLTGDLLRHACMRGVYGFGSPEYSPKYLIDDLEKIIAEYQLVWLTRNRPGGLKDNLAYFTPTKKDYH